MIGRMSEGALEDAEDAEDVIEDSMNEKIRWR